MTQVLALLLISFLTFGCSIPITYEAMQEPLVDIGEYDVYFLGLQRSAKMLGQMGVVNQETGNNFINASNAAYVYYIRAHTALAAGKIREFEKYLGAAYKVLSNVEEEIERVMKEVVEQHPKKGESGV